MYLPELVKVYMYIAQVELSILESKNYLWCGLNVGGCGEGLDSQSLERGFTNLRARDLNAGIVP